MTEPPRRRRDPVATRAAIVDAVLVALDDGDVAPTAKFIAQQAGVSERSIFVHFHDLDEIRLAAAVAQGERIDAIVEPVAPDGPLEDRVGALVAQREAMYPLQTGIRTAELVHARRSPDLSAMVRLRRAQLRDQVVAALTPEIEAASDRDRVVEALDAILDWSFRHQLVVRQELDQAGASAVVRQAVLTLLQ